MRVVAAGEGVWGRQSGPADGDKARSIFGVGRLVGSWVDAGGAGVGVEGDGEAGEAGVEEFLAVDIYN